MIVKIKLTGNDPSDFKLINSLAELKRKPKGYTWQHLDDFNPIDGTCSMQLVATEVHILCNSHIGSEELLIFFTTFNIYQDGNNKMEKVIIEEAEINIELLDLTDFETKFEIQLPNNYKDFLLRYNGGIIEENDYISEYINNTISYFP